MNLRTPEIAAAPLTRAQSDNRGTQGRRLLVNVGVPADPYLPLALLSQYAGLSIRTLRTYLSTRVHPLPSYRVGGKILVRRSDFDEWMNQFRVTSESVGVDSLVNDVLQGLG